MNNVLRFPRRVERVEVFMRDQSEAVEEREVRRFVRHCAGRFLMGLVGGAAAAGLVLAVVGGVI